MSLDAQASLKSRKILFAVLLALIGVLVVYSVFFSEQPWVVPEEFKTMKNPLAATEANLQAGKTIYLDQCANCHGDGGKGDGPEAHMHSPAPSNFTDARHMNTVSDGVAFYQITQGRRPMPSFKRKLTDDQRWQLVLFVRAFSKPFKN